VRISQDDGYVIAVLLGEKI